MAFDLIGNQAIQILNNIPVCINGISLGNTTLTKYKTDTFTMQAYAFTGDTLLSDAPPNYDGIDCSYTIIGDVVHLSIPANYGLINLGTIPTTYVYLKGFPVEILPTAVTSIPIVFEAASNGPTQGSLKLYATDRWMIMNSSGNQLTFPGSSCNNSHFWENSSQGYRTVSYRLI